MIAERTLRSKPHAFPNVPQMCDARIDLWRPRHEFLILCLGYATYLINTSIHEVLRGS